LHTTSSDAELLTTLGAASGAGQPAAGRPKWHWASW